MSPKLQFISLLTIGLVAASAREIIPVYMWQTIPTKGLLPALTRVSQDTFKEILLQKQAHQHSDRIIIFAEQNLSPEDFSAKTFYEMSQLADHSRVTYLPTVLTPMEVIQDFGSEVHNASVDDIVKNPKLLEFKQLVIELDDAREDEDRVMMLKRHSKFIAEVFEKVSASTRDNVLAIYTGRHPSWVVPSEIIKHRTRRAAANGILKTTKHYLVYIDGVFVFTTPGTPEDIKKELTVNDVTETEDEKKLNIVTSEGNVVLNYAVDGFKNWVVSTVVYDKYTYMANFNCPVGFSYSCSSNLTLREHPGSEAGFKATYIQFPTFQVQYFSDGVPASAAFYDSYDCVGFTSPAIWSGLFVTFILAIIISLGLTMIMDIKTMDRFDDPKGKTITVSATE